MSNFKEREQAFENKFAHDEELKFRIASRRRKLLGLWAGEQFHLSDDKALEYAMEIVQFGTTHNEAGAVVKKILADAEKNGVVISEDTLREQIEVLEREATAQIMAN